jgi:hypothetical protein
VCVCVCVCVFRYQPTVLHWGGQVDGLTPEQVQQLVASKKLTILDVRSPDDGASDVEWMNPVSSA